MSHPIHRVTSFEIVGQFLLTVWFEDETSQTIDFEPVLKGELFGALLDEHLFQKVILDEEAHTLVWPNGADFDPATLHDWPQHADSMRELAERWESALAQDT
jgi:hypothetical protein